MRRLNLTTVAVGKINRFVYVSSYTSVERPGRGEGINVYRIEPDGNWIHIQLYKNISLSVLAFDRTQQYLYAVQGDGDKISALKIDQQTGEISLINEQATHGEKGVGLAVDITNRFVIMANYLSGTIVSLPINSDGSLGPVADLVVLSGKPGPVRHLQDHSFPHDVGIDPSGQNILVPDRGLDKIFTYRINAEGKLYLVSVVSSRMASGPRHLDFHPLKPYVYVVNELNSTVTTYKLDAQSGEMEPIQVITTLPTDFTGNSYCAEIRVHPSGKYVYVSNRGHGSIAIYTVDHTVGTLTTLGWESTQGKTPRYFSLNRSGTMLYAANQDSDTIVAFKVQDNGTLVATGHIIETGSPACII